VCGCRILSIRASPVDLPPVEGPSVHSERSGKLEAGEPHRLAAKNHRAAWDGRRYRVHYCVGLWRSLRDREDSGETLQGYHSRET
jgi:hypothetical protein